MQVRIFAAAWLQIKLSTFDYCQLLVLIKCDATLVVLLKSIRSFTLSYIVHPSNEKKYEHYRNDDRKAERLEPVIRIDAVASEALQLRFALQGEPEAVVVLGAPPAPPVPAQVGATSEVALTRHFDCSLRLASVVLIVVAKVRSWADAE